MTIYSIVDPAGQASGFLTIDASIGTSWSLPDVVGFSFSYSVYDLHYSLSTLGLVLALRSPASSDVLTDLHPFQNGGDFSAWDPVTDVALMVTRDAFNIVWGFSDVLSPSDEADVTARSNPITYALSDVSHLPSPDGTMLLALSLAIVVVCRRLRLGRHWSTRH